MPSIEKDEYGRSVPLRENLFGTRRIAELNKKWRSREPLLPTDIEELGNDAERRVKLSKVAAGLGGCIFLVGMASQDKNLMLYDAQTGILIAMGYQFIGMYFQDKLDALEKFKKPKEKQSSPQVSEKAY